MTLLSRMFFILIFFYGPEHLTSKNAKRFSVWACVIQLEMILRRLVSSFVIHVSSLPKTSIFTRSKHSQEPIKFHSHVQHCALVVLRPFRVARM
jgi:hypothetical protein